jgi:hypothetical protein
MVPFVRRPDYKQIAGNAQRGIALASLSKSEADLDTYAALMPDEVEHYYRLIAYLRAASKLNRMIQESAEYLAQRRPFTPVLDHDDRTVLVWIGDQPRSLNDAPAAMNVAMTATIRRKLVKKGFVHYTYCDGGLHLVEVTDAGKAYLQLLALTLEAAA